mmetsp:Transcript_706/g.1636  ORF Transcript_706/g.1636 Transcript_706/m.1636 type:complete len:246 (+) Transcript_706:133-870(+)
MCSTNVPVDSVPASIGGGPLSDIDITKNVADQNDNTSNGMCCPSSPLHKKPTSDASSSPAAKKVRKSVSFHEEDRVRPIRRLSDIPSKERHSIWLSDKDYEDIQAKAKRCVKAIQSGATRNIDCSRGFENLFTEAILSLTEKQKELTRSRVLLAQEDGASAEDLASISMQSTRDATERALAAAAMDEDDMRCIVLEAKTVKKKPKKKGLSRVLSMESFGSLSMSSTRRTVFGRATLPRYSLELSE